MNDCARFATLLAEYNHRRITIQELIQQIEEVECDHPMYYYLLADDRKRRNLLTEAREYIDKAVTALMQKQEGIEEFVVQLVLDRPENQLAANIYSLAGKIYAKLECRDIALRYYQRYVYYMTFVRSEFEGIDPVPVFSFRRCNEYSLSDLRQDAITVCATTEMNDPFDSLINLWGSREELLATCTDTAHVEPMSMAFAFFRVRCFCYAATAYQNILMWSHYAGEHTGFCVKYRLSPHFVKQEQSSQYDHMYLKKIQYKDEQSIAINPIDTNVALATKHKCWEYEQEVRLIVYNPNRQESHYEIALDADSYIEAIYFGYKCSSENIRKVREIFEQKKNSRMPKFYKMGLNRANVYQLDCQEI